MSYEEQRSIFLNVVCFSDQKSQSLFFSEDTEYKTILILQL